MVDFKAHNYYSKKKQQQQKQQQQQQLLLRQNKGENVHKIDLKYILLLLHYL